MRLARAWRAPGHRIGKLEQPSAAALSQYVAEEDIKRKFLARADWIEHAASCAQNIKVRETMLDLAPLYRRLAAQAEELARLRARMRRLG